MQTTVNLATACAEAERLAENERLSEAVEVLGDVFRGPLEYPHIPDQKQKALILVTVADLSARIGHEDHLAGSQEHVKNLLSEAINLLQSQGGDVADARIKLAVAYLREGAYDECRIVIEEAVPRDGKGKAKKILVESILHYRAGFTQRALNALTEAEELFAGIGETLRGKFHLQRAIMLFDLGETDRAIIEYQAATVYFEEGKNELSGLAVRVNLAELFLTVKDYARALTNIDLAIRASRRLDSKNTLASCDETKARILIKTGRLSEARKAINEAVGIFRQGDEHSLHSEALVTHGRVLAKLGLEAKPAFDQAISEAEFGYPLGVANACLAMVEELSLPYPAMATLYVRADKSLADTKRADMLARLHECAQKIINYVPHTFEEAKEINLHHEALAIDAALNKSKGSVRAAAKLLGTTHAKVRYHIKRNPNSTADRNPASKKSIIR